MRYPMTPRTRIELTTKKLGRRPIDPSGEKRVRRTAWTTDAEWTIMLASLAEVRFRAANRAATTQAIKEQMQQEREK